MGIATTLFRQIYQKKTKKKITPQQAIYSIQYPEGSTYDDGFEKALEDGSVELEGGEEMLQQTAQGGGEGESQGQSGAPDAPLVSNA